MPNSDQIFVPYKLPGSSQSQWMDIYTRMSLERIIFLNQPITDSFANRIVSYLLYLESDDNTKPIYLYINSLGDPVAAGMVGMEAGMMSIMAGLSIYDTIQHIKSEVRTICLGQSMGIATLLLSAGAPGNRASLPNSTIGLMPVRAGTRGQASDIIINAAQVLAKKSTIVDIFAKTTGKSPEKIQQDSERMFYMTPHEAKEYGLIDRVLESSKELPTL
jgi:ATP-dependent Clp protease, protease subunit